MVNIRTLVLLFVLTLVFPPVGFLAILIYLWHKLAKKASEGGGIATRTKYDAWAREEPWWTGDPEKDEVELAAPRRCGQGGRLPDFPQSRRRAPGAR